MSGALKGIKKVFKTVGRVVKKVALPALAIGAVVFTGGAALGLAPMAGGFGGAVASTLGSMGISGTGALGSALTGAVTQAGYGAVMGGVTAAVTGGDVSKGIATGGMLGAATGGLSGALRPAAGMSPTVSGRNLPGGPMARPGGLGSVTAPAAPGLGAAVPPPDTGMATRIGTGIASRIGTGLGKFMENPAFGQTLAGVGTGLAQGIGQKAQAEEARETREDEQAFDLAEQARRTASYEVEPSAYRSKALRSSAPTPAERWAPRRYRYNRERKEIEFG